MDIVNYKMRNLDKKNGLAYSIVREDGEEFDQSSTVTVGTMVDSFYEYLLKQWIQTGRHNN